MTIESLYREILNKLYSAGIYDYEYEAQAMIEAVLGLNHIGFINHKADTADPEKVTKLLSMASIRATGEPLQYVLGSWSFAGLELLVGKGVLIPRDDTEVVLNLCMDYLRENDLIGKASIFDICSGSGAIAFALEKYCGATGTAVEYSDEAFEYLNKNCNLHNSKFKLRHGDLFLCHQQYFNGIADLIVANPPYIKSADISTLQKEVQFEPRMALDGGEDGFDFYRGIIKHWSCKLKKGGALAFELGEGQAEYVAELMRENGFIDIKTALDLGNTERAIIGIYKL